MKPLLTAVCVVTVLTAFAGCERGSATSEKTVEIGTIETPADLQKKAQEGNAEAQSKLADRYCTGEGVPKDVKQAMEWYRKAADKGHADAQYKLGLVQLRGEQPKQDLDEARAASWFEKAASQKHAEAQYQLARLLLVNFSDEEATWQIDHFCGFLSAKVERSNHVAIDSEKGMVLLRAAAENGSIDAQSDLGARYFDGKGVPKDAQQAVAWWRKAADAGNSYVQSQLGFRYRDGNGVPKDASIAFEFFSKSAALGYVPAQIQLGHAYFNGIGTPKDTVLGYAWTNLAAASGEELALTNRAAMEARMERKEITEAQQLSSSWKKGIQLARAGFHSASAAGSQNESATRKGGTGTFFIVSKEGYGITNKHVVADCKEMRVPGSGVATVLTTDSANDLALIKMAGSLSEAADIVADASRVRQGDDIVVFGFPLDSVLSSGGNLTPGVVSALTGLGNNTSLLQITAPIQPGSSGSPVLNKKGEVIGVVSHKLSDAAMAKATGSIGQNVNFAVNGHTLRAFLDANRVEFKSGAGLFSGEKNAASLADSARRWTHVIECWK